MLSAITSKVPTGKVSVSVETSSEIVSFFSIVSYPLPEVSTKEIFQLVTFVKEESLAGEMVRALFLLIVTITFPESVDSVWSLKTFVHESKITLINKLMLKKYFHLTYQKIQSKNLR